MKLDITAIILTYNEELHLQRCIESIQGFCRHIIVVDSFSNDKTQIIAESLGVEFYQNPWINHAHQFNWALNTLTISTEWILRIDADEYIEEPLKQEIADSLINTASSVNGFYLKRKYLFLGQWIKHGSMYPINVLRLWRKNTGYVEQRWMDEHVVLKKGEINTLTASIVDDNLNNISWWISKHNHYASLEMIELLNLKYQFLNSDNSMEKQGGQAGIKRWIKTHIYAKLPYFIRPTLYFLYRYFLKLGFLDGIKGFAFHFMHAYWYRSLVDLKVLEAEEWIAQERNPAKIKHILSEKTGLNLALDNINKVKPYNFLK